MSERKAELPDQILGAARDGDPSALRALIGHYQERVYSFASRMCRSREDAKDVLQDTLLSAVRALRSFRGEGSFTTWMFRIAANACRKMRRRGKFEPERELSLDEFLPQPGHDGFPEVVDWSETPDTSLARDELRRALEDAITALPEAYRAVLLLRDVEGLSTEGTAQALDLTPQAVKTRLHRARLAVRDRLAATVARP